MKTPRTKKEILADPRVQKLDGKIYKVESDILWQEDDGFSDSGRPAWWCVLADGWNNGGCSCVHECTLKEIGQAITYAEEGPTY